MIRANYHTHSRWCGHGNGEIEEYIEAAIQYGLEEIAITEHVPHLQNENLILIQQNKKPMRMEWSDFLSFNAELDFVIEKYQDKIKIIKGFECEYYPEAIDNYLNFKEKYNYELLFLGQHKSGKNHEFENFAVKNVEQLELYATEVCEGIATGLFAFLAHPDMVLHNYNQNQWDEHCERIMRKIFATCEKYQIPVELNAQGLRNQAAYPSYQAFQLSKEYHLQYLIGSDAHSPSAVYDEAVKKIETMAKQLGIEAMNVK